MARLDTASRGRTIAEVALAPFAQIVFSRDPVVGALILAAIAVFPRLAVATLAAVAVAQLTTWLLGLGTETVRSGAAGCAAVLATLATAYSLNGGTAALVVIGAVSAAVFTAALKTAMAGAMVPPLSLPFVFAAWTVNLAARALPASDAPLALATPWSALPVSALSPGWLDVPAAILFVHGALVGTIVLAAVIWHSRIGGLLAGLGGLVAMAVRAALRPDVDWSVVDMTASFNAVLTAMALGGVWFVPHASSLLLAAGGAAATCVITYALFPVTALASLPLLSLPFAATTILVLLATRQRERDHWPASAPVADRPEDALTLHLMRVRRFGEFAWLPFRLPFRGSWVVTQGHSGPHTHTGPWRYAFDFEVMAADGRAFDGEGTTLADYRCYGLPVLAAGSGTVEQVIDGVPDNPVGGVNARDNWGNAVVIAHGSNLYSVAAHLRPRSITVKPGDMVRAGVEIGKCGNSGRSPVPHLHFHVQRGALLGGETIPADFGDVVSRTNERTTVDHRVIPHEGETVRPIVRDEAIASALAFPPASAWTLVEEGSGQREVARMELDLWSRRVLRSSLGRLYVEPYESGLVVVAFHGDRRSLLRYLLPALARVPFDQESGLTWRDRVPRRLLFPWPWSFADLAAVVTPRLTDYDVTYTARRTERAVVVEGTATRFSTRAVVSLAGEPHRIEITRRGRTTTVTLAPATASEQEAA